MKEVLLGALLAAAVIVTGWLLGIWPLVGK